MYFDVFLIIIHVSLVCIGQVIKPPAQYLTIDNHQEENVTDSSVAFRLRKVFSDILDSTDPDLQSALDSQYSTEQTTKGDEIEPAQKAILDGTLLRVYQDSIDNYQVVHLTTLEDILPHLDTNKNWVFVTFGFNESPESPGPREVVSALLESKKYNVVLLDWSNLTSVGPIGSLKETKFIDAINNAQTIGCGLGKGLVALNRTGVDIRSRVVALVGHDFGAQIMGEAATCAIINKIEMRLVWGLDPAGLLYSSIFGPLPPLNSRIAEYVYSIHTDPLGFGSNEGMTTVDFWVNYKGPGGFMQPGCSERADKDSLKNQSLCNHQRAWYLFADGIRYPDSMPAVHAKRGTYWETGRTEENSPLAYITVEPSPGARGQYFLRTRSKAPFGLYMVGVVAQRPPNSTIADGQTNIDKK